MRLEAFTISLSGFVQGKSPFTRRHRLQADFSFWLGIDGLPQTNDEVGTSISTSLFDCIHGQICTFQQTIRVG